MSESVMELSEKRKKMKIEKNKAIHLKNIILVC